MIGNSAHTKIRTSVYIRKDRKERIKLASQKLGVSIHRIYSVLLYQSRNILGNKTRQFKNVEYQKTFADEAYRIATVSFYKEDYEYATSVRDLFKVSVSLLLALAVDTFLDDILERGIDSVIDDPDLSCKKHNYEKYRVIIRKYDVKHYVRDQKEYWEYSWDRQRE